MPIATIVIPTYNHGRFVKQAVQSCLAQTCQDIEILVIDDGSTDGTSEVVRALLDDDRVRYVHQQNSGVAAARNRGLALATARYVNFLDADDALYPEKIARQAAVLDANPGIGLVSCDITVVDEAGAEIPDRCVAVHQVTYAGGLLPALLRNGLFPPMVPLVRTELVQSVGGFDADPQLAGHADYLLWLCLTAADVRHHHIPEPLAYYREVSGSMSHDLDHMRSSRLLALQTLAHAAPEATARGIVSLGSWCDDLEHANTWLQASADNLLARLAMSQPAAINARLALLTGLVRARHRAVWIWGAGSAGRQARVALTHQGVDIAGFIDSDPAKHGTMVDGAPIVAYDHRFSAEQNGARPYVVIASAFHQAIAATLSAAGARPDQDFVVFHPEAVQ